jgi:hypothetical protein
MTRRFTAGAFLLPLLPMAAHAQLLQNRAAPENYHLRGEYRFFSSDISGTVERGLAGTEIDLKDDLGFSDDRTWEARATIRIGHAWKLRATYTNLDYRGQATLTSPIRYAGITFNRNEAVSSSLKGGFWAGELEWDFISGRHGYLGVVGGAELPDVDTIVSSPDTGKRQTDTFRPVSPVIGLAGRAYGGRLSVEFLGKSFPKISGRRVNDFEATARLHISDRLALEGGYRYLSFKLEVDPDFVDIKVKGWVYGAELGL